MRLVVAVVILLSALSSFAGATSQLDLGGYQSADGAVSLLYHGDFVEPYFAMKAIISAHHLGMDVRQSALATIRWMLPRQQRNGSFGRYCRKPDGNWDRCAAADADDSTLALWLQLLYISAPDSGLPQEWRSSAARAKQNLDSLKNWRLGVYHVSWQNHVALLMDNVEVYSALKDVARSQLRFGQQAESQKTDDEASRLAISIQHVFWNKHDEWFRPSIQKNRPEFYPDVVAQIYPWLADLPMPSDVQTRSLWQRWKSQFASEWLNNKSDPHPWGLVALAALNVGDDNTAACWLAHAAPLRFSKNWNVLEEAAFQTVIHRTNNVPSSDPLVCSRAMVKP